MGKLQILKPDQLGLQANSSAEDWDAISATPVLTDIARALTVAYYDLLSRRPADPQDAFRNACTADGLKQAMQTIETLERKCKGKRLGLARAEEPYE